MAEKTNLYKYSTFILIIIVAAMVAFISYNTGKNSNVSITKTTVQQTSTGYTSELTTINTTTIANTNKSLYCNTQPTFVKIGNSLVCGLIYGYNSECNKYKRVIERDL